MAEPRAVTEVFALAMRLGVASGAAPLNGATWVYDIDDNWKMALNGGETPVTSKPEGCMDISIEPYEMAVWWNGWLAGTIGPYDGVLVAHPDGANEGNLITAMRWKLESLTKEVVSVISRRRTHRRK